MRRFGSHVPWPRWCCALAAAAAVFFLTAPALGEVTDEQVRQAIA